MNSSYWNRPKPIRSVQWVVHMVCTINKMPSIILGIVCIKTKQWTWFIDTGNLRSGAQWELEQILLWRINKITHGMRNHHGIHIVGNLDSCLSTLMRKLISWMMMSIEWLLWNEKYLSEEFHKGVSMTWRRSRICNAHVKQISCNAICFHSDFIAAENRIQEILNS